MFERNGFQTAFQEQFKLAVLKFNIEKINYLAKHNINPNHVFIADGQIEFHHLPMPSAMVL